jgi:metal-dependent amidase/aminoacylase/carboxypeptidase family protein
MDRRIIKMSAEKVHSGGRIATDSVSELLPELENFYADLPAHPELSMQETRTAGLAADRLLASGHGVTARIGETGVVALLSNGDGPTVMLRAGMDALSVKEATGLPYASTVTAADSAGKSVPVAHAFGHDMHVACLDGASALRAEGENQRKAAVGFARREYRALNFSTNFKRSP